MATVGVDAEKGADQGQEDPGAASTEKAVADVEAGGEVEPAAGEETKAEPEDEADAAEAYRRAAAERDA